MNAQTRSSRTAVSGHKPAAARRRFTALAATLGAALALGAFAPAAHAVDPQKKELVFGATAGPYADQVKYGIKPILEKQGYKVKLVEFNDYIQPNFALAQGSLDANVFQHEVYLRKFSTENKLDLVEVLKVPTAPIAVYSRKHRSTGEVKEGTTVAIPNDPANAARALVVLDRKLGWIRLREGYDPIRASEKDIAQNLKGIKLVPLEAAQLPRSLDDIDFSFINGNFALASGLKLTEALVLEDTTPTYQNVVAVRTADKDREYVKDIAAAWQSKEFLAVTNQRFAGFVKPEWQVALEGKTASVK
ncbi:MetQ/NlpA family ABC transporter substrate-binding protein [Derxia gummosa]|uniref:MetQ/NlpA family ABC transporter substrate-binding protein n=1 Tax=Derxia gummosa DSM 723 TaxID=1121388 RepID=A0A8B6X9Q4_9BURK|nr:MetQ/NlpA family ABC transporter substrate-binding protein [Derxia gummosa]